jgi:signal transduction histidine kinase
MYAEMSLRERLLALVLRPTAPPLLVGVVTAAALIALEVLLVSLLKQVAPENAFGAVFLLGVLVVSASWGFGLALATSLASTLAYVWFHLMEGSGSLAPAALLFLTIALLSNVLVGQARLRALEADERRREADQAAAAVSALAEQQAALRRVATKVARGADPAAVYPVAVAELARSLHAEHVTLLRFHDGEAEVLATADDQNTLRLQVGERLALGGDGVAAQILATGVPARVDDYRTASGPTVARVMEAGLASGVGAPITVDGRVWGALLVGSAQPAPMPADTEEKVCDFADLVATAILNSETRAELTASRARIVAAADSARRGFERDLHDGAQQRIVSLGLELGAIQSAVAADNAEAGAQLSEVVRGLSGLYSDLQELSRGIHPAILSRGGLGPAIKTLARRSPVPVDLQLEIDATIPDTVEVAAYYVTAEALTNTAKYAQASEVRVHARTGAGQLHLRISDDGIGGARAGGGSGLVGLKDRVNALSGELTVESPPGSGTTLAVTIPLTPQH